MKRYIYLISPPKIQVKFYKKLDLVLKTKKVKYKASIKILNWAKKTTNIPIVAIGGIKFENYKKLLLNKANFLAISSYIWNNKKYKPLEAINKLK